MAPCANLLALDQALLFVGGVSSPLLMCCQLFLVGRFIAAAMADQQDRMFHDQIILQRSNGPWDLVTVWCNKENKYEWENSLTELLDGTVDSYALTGSCQEIIKSNWPGHILWPFTSVPLL